MYSPYTADYTNLFQFLKNWDFSMCPYNIVLLIWLQLGLANENTLQQTSG